jgi:hypothetical protein
LAELICRNGSVFFLIGALDVVHGWCDETSVLPGATMD